MGRKLKLKSKSAHELSALGFKLNARGELEMSDNLAMVARALDIEAKLA